MIIYELMNYDNTEINEIKYVIKINKQIFYIITKIITYKN